MFSQDTFKVYAASEGMMDILRKGTSQALYADQDMEERMVRVAVGYIEQQRISSSILSDEALSLFLNYYGCQRQYSNSLSRMERPVVIPYWGNPIQEMQRNYLKIVCIGGYYMPLIVDGRLIFARAENELTERDLAVHSSEADDIIISLFDAAKNGVGIRATVERLAVTLDLEYALAKSRKNK